MEKLKEYKETKYIKIYQYNDFDEFKNHSEIIKKEGFIIYCDGKEDSITYQKVRIQVKYTKIIKEEE